MHAKKVSPTQAVLLSQDHVTEAEHTSRRTEKGSLGLVAWRRAVAATIHTMLCSSLHRSARTIHTLLSPSTSKRYLFRANSLTLSASRSLYFDAYSEHRIHWRRQSCSSVKFDTPLSYHRYASLSVASAALALGLLP